MDNGPRLRYQLTLMTWRSKASRKWLDGIFDKMINKFGKLTRQRLPFMHCGCRYSRIADGYKVDQQEYVEMLKPVKLPDGDEERMLTAAETTLLRSAIGALMWTALTRPDLLADLSTLQGVMNKAKVRHLKDANDLVAKAKRDKEAAIYYRDLGTASYRIVCIHDASAASSTKNYAQEGVIVVLMSDVCAPRKTMWSLRTTWRSTACQAKHSSCTASPTRQKGLLLNVSWRDTGGHKWFGVCDSCQHAAG